VTVNSDVQKNDNMLKVMSYSVFETTFTFINNVIASVTHNNATNSCLPYHCVHAFAQFTCSGFSESTTLGVFLVLLLAVARTF